MATLVTSAAPNAATAARRYYALLLLTLIYGLNFLDRTVFNVLIEPIKTEFGLSDTTIGLLAGFGFVLLYSALGMPIARFADRANRRNIVAAGLALWSAMTMLCGFAQGAWMLALARVGVGLGEAAGTPASQSIVADLFTQAERPRALGIYAIGTYVGIFLGYFFGGWINHFYGWRVAFIGAGAPGVLLAIVLLATVREPARSSVGRGAAATLAAGVAFLSSQRTFLIVLIGFCVTTFANYASSVWIPPFLARVHHLSSADVGTYAGTFKGLFGVAGTLLGGFVTERLARRDERWLLWAPAIMSGVAGPIFAVCMLTHSFLVSIVALGLFSAAVGFHLGPIFSLGQTVAKPELRALGAATLLLTATLFGQGVGPLVVGVLNDALKPTYGVDAIRYSLLSAALASTLGGAVFLTATPFLKREIARAGN
ncbi:MAG: MFS transporter [Hyphomicrobiales bacterium]|nr:MFS transporter [Hyphomicrobiales bacterium]MBV8662249.1 MFS transporter [Hyphomicrobiales bacterium]